MCFKYIYIYLQYVQYVLLLLYTPCMHAGLIVMVINISVDYQHQNQDAKNVIFCLS